MNEWKEKKYIILRSYHSLLYFISWSRDKIPLKEWVLITILKRKWNKMSISTAIRTFLLNLQTKEWMKYYSKIISINYSKIVDALNLVVVSIPVCSHVKSALKSQKACKKIPPTSGKYNTNWSVFTCKWAVEPINSCRYTILGRFKPWLASWWYEWQFISLFVAGHENTHGCLTLSQVIFAISAN